jgi:DNA-directed RNA polymerase subunit RPC12/RpoP
MQCMSCQSEIDPRWKHALEINVCPNCGSNIMAEHLKKLLSTLSATMQELQQYSDQLNDWMLCNYGFIRTDSPDLTIYLPKELVEQDVKQPQMQMLKVKQPDGSIKEEEVFIEKRLSDAETKKFFDRANNSIGKSGMASRKVQVIEEKSEAPKSEVPKDVIKRTEYYKELKQQIEKEASQGIIGENALATMIETENVSSDEVAEMSSLISGGPGPTSGGDEEDRLAERALALNIQFSKNNPANKSLNEQQDLIRMRNSVADAQSRLGSGSFNRNES